MENRHRDFLRRVLQADAALLQDDREPAAFHLQHPGGGERTISHPRWDPSWSVPSEHTIDDLGELGLLRIQPHHNKARTFTLTLEGREKGPHLTEPTVGTRASEGPPDHRAARPDNSSEGDQPRDPRTVAVMHGRDAAARRAVYDFLRRLGLNPLEWDALVDLTGSGAPYNGDAVAAAFRVAQAVVVVLTPDDIGYLHPELQRDREIEDDRQPTGQARLNVVLEAGMALQSHPDRTVLLEIGRTRTISDLAGRNAVRLDGSTESLNSLASRLETAKCPVNRANSDWLDPGPFVRLDALQREPPARSNEDGNAGEQVAKRHARHISVELDTIDATAALALNRGYWWNVAVETLPSLEWTAGRDALAQHFAATYDTVAPAYVQADQLNKAAFNHTQGGHDDYGDDVRVQLERLRTTVKQAQAALTDLEG